MSWKSPRGSYRLTRPRHQHLLAVAWTVAEQEGAVLEQRTADLRPSILEREVEVAGGWAGTSWENSPCTQTSGKRFSSSPRTACDSSETVWMLRWDSIETLKSKCFCHLGQPFSLTSSPSDWRRAQPSCSSIGLPWSCPTGPRHSIATGRAPDGFVHRADFNITESVRRVARRGVARSVKGLIDSCHGDFQHLAGIGKTAGAFTPTLSRLRSVWPISRLPGASWHRLTGLFFA